MSAGCNCIEVVNEKLATRNTRLMQAMCFDGTSPLMIETEQVERGRGKQKAVGMFPSYCPFCGIKYERAPAGAADVTQRGGMEEAVEVVRGMIRLADMGLEASLREPVENGNYAAYERAKRFLAAQQSRASLQEGEA